MSVFDPETMTPRARAGSTQTSVLAAIDAAPKAPKMTDRIWPLLCEQPRTPEEVHAILSRDGERVLLTSVRARICGLHKAGLVIDAGSRGLGESLKSKVVRWRVATATERERFQAVREAAAQAAEEAAA